MSSSTSTYSNNTQSTETICPLSTKPLASTISQLCYVKLERTNFLLWESSILLIIRGHKLEGHILGSKICPQQFISEEAKVKTNPAFEEWTATDQLLLGWIYNTLKPDITSQVIG